MGIGLQINVFIDYDSQKIVTFMSKFTTICKQGIL